MRSVHREIRDEPPFAVGTRAEFTYGSAWRLTEQIRDRPPVDRWPVWSGLERVLVAIRSAP